MDRFTPLAAALGGLLIGLSASALLFLNGRIAGISGVLGGLLQPDEGGRGWRGMFLLGLAAGGFVLLVLHPGALEAAHSSGVGLPIVSGILVGVGTRLGRGCTSGHGVCGIARFSTRSIVATCVFMAAAILTVYVSRHLVGVGA
jgi:uncharacterized membrane protein YedE/YeeE